MEGLAETEERFKFPYFELCNFYAAKSIAGLLEGLEKTLQKNDNF